MRVNYNLIKSLNFNDKKNNQANKVIILYFIWFISNDGGITVWLM